MHGADEPAKRDLMIQSLQAAPCFAGRGHINQRQQNSGDNLQKKDGERGAAKDVEPARRVSRHGMFSGLANRRCELQAMVEPFADSLDQAHGGFSEVRRCHWVAGGWQLSGVNREHSVFDFVRIFEEPALRRSRRARAIAVVCAAVTRTHEQAGLREPADGAAEMCAVDGKHLKLIARDAAHPARCVYSLSIGWHDQGIAKSSHPRLSLRKVADISEAAPTKDSHSRGRA